LTIKVPSDKFDSLLNYIIDNANIRSLETKSVQIKDVTEEFIDIEARLKIKKESHQKLSELLKQAKNLTEHWRFINSLLICKLILNQLKED